MLQSTEILLDVLPVQTSGLQGRLKLDENSNQKMKINNFYECRL